jgi:hypothetical protein
MNTMVEIRAANTHYLVTHHCKGRLLTFDEKVGKGRNLARRFLLMKTQKPKKETIDAIETAFNLETGWLNTDHGYPLPNEGGDAPLTNDPATIKYIDMLAEERKKPKNEQNHEIIAMCISILKTREGVATPCTCEGGSLKKVK